jgi:hypothetical protein
MKRLILRFASAALILGAAVPAHAASLTIAWDASANATGYYVLYGTASGAITGVYPNKVDAGSATQFTISGLADGTTYYFSVQAYNTVGASGDSSEVYATTPLPTITPAANKGFAGNGKASLIWQHDTGMMQAWFLNGTSAAGQNFNPSAVTDPSWRIVGSGDFNNDGNPDLLFQNTITGVLVVWYMNGTQLVSASVLSPAGPSDPNWRVVGIADFNADGRPDLLFQHSLTGMLFVWYMNGASMYGTAMFTPFGPNDPAWKVAAVADFNGDGKPDILLQHKVTSTLVYWYMNGSTLSSAALTTPMAPLDPNWKVVGVADINGNGTLDLIMQHQLTGGLVVWYMNGTTVQSGGSITPNGSADTAWKIVAIK